MPGWEACGTDTGACATCANVVAHPDYIGTYPPAMRILGGFPDRITPMPLMVAPLVDPPALFLRVRFDAGSESLPELGMPGPTGACSEVELTDGKVVGVAQSRSLLPRSLRSRRKAPPKGPAAGVAAHLASNRNPGAVPMQLAFVVTELPTADSLLAEARELGRMDSLWLMAENLDLLVDVRRSTAAARLILRCRPAEYTGGPERLASDLRELSVDGALMPEIDLTAGSVALFHRFGRLLLADGADYERTVRRALQRGADGMVGADPEAFAAATL